MYCKPFYCCIKWSLLGSCCMQTHFNRVCICVYRDISYWINIVLGMIILIKVYSNFILGAWVAHTAAVRGDPVARPPSSSTTVSSASITSTIPANERECLLGPISGMLHLYLFFIIYYFYILFFKLSSFN